MQKSKSQRYLGDIISANGKNDENIADRFKRGIGLATQITGILKEISFGQFFFEQALLFSSEMQSWLTDYFVA